MDTADYQRLIAALDREADVARLQAQLLREHRIGEGWWGRVRREAESALAHTIDDIARAERALHAARDDSAAAWRQALTASSFLG